MAGRKTTDGVPARAHEAAETAPQAYARVTRHRVNALLNQVLDRMEAERTKGTRDWVAKLVTAYHDSADPLGLFERIMEMMAKAEPEGRSNGQAPALALNVAQMYLAGVRDVNDALRPAPVTIEATPALAGVQSGLGDW